MASIHDRKGRPKRWQVKYRNTSGDQRSQSFRTLDEAKEYAASVSIDLRSGSYVDPRRAMITFGMFASDVLAAIEQPLRPKSRSGVRGALRSRILPYWGNVPLGAIHHTAVQDWITTLTGDGLAPATVRKYFQVFRTFITAAEDARIIPGKPWGKLRFPKIEKHEARFLEPAEVDRLADAIGDDLRAFVYLGAVCGLRAGELLGLRWRDVDFHRRTVEVREIVTEVDGLQYVGPPKTAASRRRVPMPAVVVDELELHALTRTDPDGLVFPAGHGRHWCLHNFRNRVWKPACAAAGLVGLVIHELRHSAVAGWIESGAEPTEVAARAGHRSVVTILDRYGHRFPSQAQRVNDNIDALYRAAREAS